MKNIILNEGFDFQGIADEFNNKQDELEKNNGLNIDLNKNNNIDIVFSSGKELINYAWKYAEKHDGKFVLSQKSLYKRSSPLEYLKLYHVSNNNFFSTTLDAFKKIYLDSNIGGNRYIGPSIFVIFIDTFFMKKIGFVFRYIDKTFEEVLDKIFTSDKFISRKENFYIKKIDSDYVTASYYCNDISKISVFDLDRILNAVYKQKALKINENKNLK